MRVNVPNAKALLGVLVGCLATSAAGQDSSRAVMGSRPGVTATVAAPVIFAQLADTGSKQPHVPRRPAPRGEARIAYVPPYRGAPSLRVGAGTRGEDGKASLVVLAPDYVAWTATPRPSLYWFTPLPIADPVEVLVIDDESVDPLLELRIEPPVEAGIHGLDLAARGVALEAGRAYRWSVAIMHDPAHRSRDTYVEGAVMLVPPQAAVSGQVAGASPEARARAYAGAGYWYDALGALNRLIETGSSTDAVQWREQRMALLGQVGIDLSGHL